MYIAKLKIVMALIINIVENVKLIIKLTKK